MDEAASGAVAESGDDTAPAAGEDTAASTDAETTDDAVGADTIGRRRH